MSQADLVIDMKANRSDRALPHSPVVLIEIPEIKPMPVSRVTRRAHQRVRESETSRTPIKKTSPP